METLGKVQHHHVFDDKTATHVVTGVLYGAEAFFFLDRQVLDLRKSNGHLNVLASNAKCEYRGFRKCWYQRG